MIVLLEDVCWEGCHGTRVGMSRNFLLESTVYVPIEYDSLDEDDETLTLILSNPTVAQIERGVATGTIVDYE